MAESGWNSSLNTIRHSQLIRLLLIGFLVLLLQIPVSMVQDVISERQSTRSEALREITEQWGGEQLIVGPRLVIPYLKKWVDETEDGSERVRTETRYGNFLPETLEVSGTLKSEVRYRGIFEFPVYRTDLRLRGDFAPPDFSGWDLQSEDILWERSRLVLKISDPRSIQDQTTLTLGDSKVQFLPGAFATETGGSGIHAPLGAVARDGLGEFDFPLSLNGSVGVFFVPFGRDTKVQLASSWADPSFQGAWLPTQRSVTRDGFTALWQIPFLGRTYSQSWDSKVDPDSAIEASRFGVRLISPVDEYRMAERSVKYAALFILLTFGSLWLFEVLVKVRIHSLQYLLVGGAMCLFYLLELSLSEHLGFLPAYMLAAFSMVALVFAYCAVILQSKRRALIISGVLAGLYAYLYVLLINQDYALVVGSIGLFIILALVMYLTRKVDWYSVGS